MFLKGERQLPKFACANYNKNKASCLLCNPNSMRMQKCYESKYKKVKKWSRHGI